MGKKLFVGSLSWDTNDDGLHEAFAQFGEITEAKVITDRDSGRSRGFGFVEMSSDAEATEAIRLLSDFFQPYVKANTTGNVVCISAPQSFVERIRSDLAKIDEPPVQILIEFVQPFAKSPVISEVLEA